MAKEESNQFPGAFSLLKPSAKALMLNKWTFLALIALSILLNFVGSDIDTPARSLLYVLSVAGAFIIAPAFPITQLRSAKGVEISAIDAIKEGLPFVIRMLLLQIVSSVIILAGLILLIVPGIFAIQRLLLVQFYLIDKDMGVIEAIKASFNDSKEYSGAVWGLIGAMLAYLLLVFTIILSPLAIGLLIAYICAPAIRYFQIQAVAKKA